MCSTDSEYDGKDNESSHWKKGDCHVLTPVASGTVDTGEVVGVDWWSIARHTVTTQLTLSAVYIPHLNSEVVSTGVGMKYPPATLWLTLLTRTNM